MRWTPKGFLRALLPAGRNEPRPDVVAVVPPRDEAQALKIRAHEAIREAEAGLTEMQGLTRSIRALGRDKNHFAPLIYDTLKRK